MLCREMSLGPSCAKDQLVTLPLSMKHTVVGVAVIVEVLFVVHRHSSHRTVLFTSFLFNFAYAAE